MAKSGEMGTLLTIGLIGAGVYFAWPYISQLLGSLSSTPTMPTTPPAPSPAAPVSTVSADPCSGVSIDFLLPGVTQGAWTALMATAANAMKVPIACQNALIQQASVNAQLQSASRVFTGGVGGLGRNYVRRGTPMRRFL